MAIVTQSSLFDPAPLPVMESSVSWIGDVMFGKIPLGLCVVAVVFLEAMMLTGRMPVRAGLRVVLGCFVLLDAPVIASAFMQSGERVTAPAPVPLVIETERQVPRTNLPPADYDPYAGASLRRD